MKLKTKMIISNFSKIRHLLIIFLLTVTIVACDKDDDTVVNDELSVEEIIDLGWEYFAANDYSGALEKFEAAISRGGSIADAHNGAGWSHGHMIDGLSSAANSFSQSYSADTTMYDALGGWAFVAFEQGKWVSAIEKSDSLLHRRPGWRFLHESNTNFQDIRLMMAQANFYTLDFESCYNIITDFFNPSFEADVTTEQGQMELQLEIERLRLIYG